MYLRGHAAAALKRVQQIIFIFIEYYGLIMFTLVYHIKALKLNLN